MQDRGKEGARDFIRVSPFISLWQGPGCDFRLLQSVADSSQHWDIQCWWLAERWEVTGFSPNLISHPREKRSCGNKAECWVSVLCWPHEYHYLKGQLLLGSFVHAVLGSKLSICLQEAYPKSFWQIINRSNLNSQTIQKIDLFLFKSLAAGNSVCKILILPCFFLEMIFWWKSSFVLLKCSRNGNMATPNWV